MALKTVTEDLQSPEDYELITYSLMEKLTAENVLHAEVYVCVGFCLWRKQDFGATFEGIERGRQRGQRDFGTSELSTRQIPLEICLTSNLRTGCCRTLADHPVRNYFDHGIMITLNTDDPAMFATSLAREYQLAQKAFEFTDEHLRELARNSFEASFLPAEKKLEFLNLFDAAAPRT